MAGSFRNTLFSTDCYLKNKRTINVIVSDRHLVRSATVRNCLLWTYKQ